MVVRIHKYIWTTETQNFQNFPKSMYMNIGAYGHKFRAQRPYGQNFPGDPPTPGRGWVNTSRGISRQKFSACGEPKATFFDVLPVGILNFPWFPHVIMALSRCARLNFAQVAHNFAGVPAGFFNPNLHSILRFWSLRAQYHGLLYRSWNQPSAAGLDFGLTAATLNRIWPQKRFECRLYYFQAAATEFPIHSQDWCM